jgi:hypothetical protein
VSDSVKMPWKSDLVLLEGGPGDEQVIEIRLSEPLLPERLAFGTPYGTVAYMRVMNGKYPSRNDQGQLRYVYIDQGSSW